MHQAETLVFLLALMTALVVVSRKLELPYPVLLVLGGLAISFIPHLPALRLEPNFVFYFCLPPLIFPAALFTSWRDFRRNLRPILLLAVGLVLFTMAAVAAVAHAIVENIPWAAAFALGAIVSPPDAIAATAVIRRLSVLRRIEAVVEGESLVNDATALVALQFAVAAVTTGSFSLGYAAVQFVFVALESRLDSSLASPFDGYKSTSMIRRCRLRLLCLRLLLRISRPSGSMFPAFSLP